MWLLNGPFLEGPLYQEHLLPALFIINSCLRLCSSGTFVHGRVHEEICLGLCLLETFYQGRAL